MLQGAQPCVDHLWMPHALCMRNLQPMWQPSPVTYAALLPARPCACQVLDVGGCGSLWRLPNSLLQLPKLEQLVVPSKALAQHVIEQLECRPDPVQVYMEPAEEEDDDWEQEAARADDTDETDDDQ